MKRIVWTILSSIILLSSCQELDKSVLAQVGEEKLMLNDVLLQMPLKHTGADSSLFVQRHVDQWVNEQLLYQQGLRNLPNLQELEAQVAQYRRDLIARSYQAARIGIYQDEVTEEECMAFYEKYKGNLKLQEPIVQGVYIQLLANSTKVKELKDWMKQILHGTMDHAEELEQFCQQRAVDYDTFMEQWVDMRRLTDRLPQKLYSPQCQVYQMKDQDYIYLFMISGYHAAGEVQPFEYCYKEIHQLLVEQEQDIFREKLQQDLRDEALRTGLLKLN